MGFKMSSKATAQAVKKASSRGSGPQKLVLDKNKRVANLLILGSTSDDMGAIFTTFNHFLWGSGKKLLSSCGSPSVDKDGNATGEKDKMTGIGWKLRDKYMVSKNQKKKDFWRQCLVNEQHHINVLDLDNLEAGPQLFSMPKTVSDVVIEEFSEAGDDITDICDFDKGRILRIKHNGLDGLQKKYLVVKLLNQTANLIEDGVLTDDDLKGIEEGLYDLKKLQIPYNEDSYEKHFQILAKQAQKIGIDLEEVNSNDEVSDDEMESEEDEAAYGDEEVDDVSLDDEDDEDEEKVVKKVVKKTVKKIIEEEEEEEIEDEDNLDDAEIDLEDDEEEEEEILVKKPEPKIQKKPVKRVIEDEDEEKVVKKVRKVLRRAVK